MTDKELRYKVRALKAFYNVPYKDMADYFNITYNSFCSWLHGYYNFKATRLPELYKKINEIESCLS